MARVKRVWHLVPQATQSIADLTRALRISPVVAQLLANRGIHDPDLAKRFLEPNLVALHPPELLPGIRPAVERIAHAIQHDEKICIFGDYDTDGVTGTAILVTIIEKLGGKPSFYIPHRLEEGYGLNVEAIRQLHASGTSLLISVDCGITACSVADEARRLGLDLIITDHHELAAELPDALALVHPRLPDSHYPFGELSGSGVAFKLAWALAQFMSGSERVSPPMREALLDAVGLAALGLVADVVPLRDENRIFVRHGLQRLVSHPPLGVQALVEAAGLKGKEIRAEDVSFKLAPRLNAAGRLGCALLVVELLTTRSPARAREIAECLEGYNTQRQTIERKMTQQAKEMVEEKGFAGDPAIVLAGADWHSGVVGIVAGRLVEHYARPVILVALKPGDEPSSGSGRSIPGFDLHLALAECTEELLTHGGHAMAAGLRVLPSRIDAFRERFVKAAENALPQGPPRPILRLDAEVPLSALTLGLLRDIDRLEPYGAENPKPRFLASGLTVEGEPRTMGATARHIHFRVRQGGTVIRAVGFGMADRLEELMSAGGACSLAFSPKLNEWQGQRKIEIDVVDLAAGPNPELG